MRQPATPDGLTVRSYVSTGACVTYHVAPAIASDVASMARLDIALGMQPRRELVERVRMETELTLCGAEAPPCAGGSG